MIIANKKPILIIKDEGRNIVAAKQYLGTRHEFRPDFVRTKEEALEKLAKDITYYLAVCDINFPDRSGELPKKNGPIIANVIDRNHIPFAYLTVGKHGEHNPARIYLNEDARQEHYSYRPENEFKLPEWRDCYASKDSPSVWERVIKAIEADYPCDMIYRARLRAKGGINLHE